MKFRFIALDIDWPKEISAFELKDFILSKLRDHGEPLRWAITSLTTHSEQTIQKIYIEAVLIVDQDKKKNIDFYLT